MKITDEEINHRLFEVMGFVPDDGFRHVRKQLRSGKVFLVVKNPKQPKQVLHCIVVSLKKN